MHFDLYFDYASPFAYLATTQVERLARERGATFTLSPILLGALFREIGTPIVPIAAMPEARRRYVLADMNRWARKWGAPFVFPTGFPLRTVDALRLTLLVPEARRMALVHAIMRATWVEDRDPASHDVLRDCAGEDRGLVDRLTEAKDALRAATDRARERGVFGVPTFDVAGQLYFGQDRLEFVAEALST